MAKTIEQYLNKQLQAFMAFRKALTAESDRGCALFASAYLDKALSDLLYLSLIYNKKIEEDLFKGMAPLSTFSSRIKLTYYLGKISAECKRDLETVRGIRNDFAHNIGLISFDTQSIADRCRNLGFSYHKKDAHPRAHFTAAACGILAIVQATGLKSVAPTARPDDRPSEGQKEAIRKQVEEATNEIEAAIKKASGAEDAKR